MDWRQFLHEEVDRRLDLLRLLMSAHRSSVANGEGIESDAYILHENRDQIAPIDALLADEGLMAGSMVQGGR
jgi:hypothetical protein